jgi:hypothetical protein
MKKSVYYLTVLGFMAALLLVSYWPAENFLKPGTFPFIFTAVAVSGLSAIIAYAILSNGMATRIQLFTAYIMGGMLAKTAVGLLTVFVVALKFKDFALEYVLSYFFCHILFTAFEVYALMRNLRPNSKKGTEQHG